MVVRIYSNKIGRFFRRKFADVNCTIFLSQWLHLLTINNVTNISILNILGSQFYHRNLNVKMLDLKNSANLNTLNHLLVLILIRCHSQIYWERIIISHMWIVYLEYTIISYRHFFVTALVSCHSRFDWYVLKRSQRLWVNDFANDQSISIPRKMLINWHVNNLRLSTPLDFFVLANSHRY